MVTNEKAPQEAATSERSAMELIHPQNTADFSCCQGPVDPMISELVKMYHHHGSVKISEGRLFSAFNFGSYDVDGSGRYSATAGGVEFFCLVENGAGPDV